MNITHENVATWEAELHGVEDRMTVITNELAEVAAPAEAGDHNARKCRDGLNAEYKRLLARADELRAAVVSGGQHLKRQADAEAEREREQARLLVRDLEAKRRKAGARVDKLLAQLEAAWIDYADIERQLLTACRKAEVQRRSDLSLTAIQPALWASAPTVGHAVEASLLYFSHCKPLADQS